MSNRLYALPKNRPAQLSGVLITSSQRRTRRWYVSVLCALSLTIYTLFLTACVTNPPKPPADSLQLPPPPSLSTPLPSVSYSKTAAQRMEGWQKRLAGTLLMSN